MKHFTLSEFDSPDVKGSGKNMDDHFLMKIDQARELAGVPFKITSGFRTKEHHESIYKKLGKKPTRSAHLTGHAVDIHVVNGNHGFLILQGLIRAGFKRIGIAKTFIHADNSPNHTSSVIWTY